MIGWLDPMQQVTSCPKEMQSTEQEAAWDRTRSRLVPEWGPLERLQRGHFESNPVCGCGRKNPVAQRSPVDKACSKNIAGLAPSPDVSSYIVYTGFLFQAPMLPSLAKWLMTRSQHWLGETKAMSEVLQSRTRFNLFETSLAHAQTSTGSWDACVRVQPMTSSVRSGRVREN